MAFSPVNVSNNILKRSFDEGVEVTPMKLQKLLYFVASEYAKATHGDPLLNESFRAWRYGPVVRSVYDEFRSFGGGPIRAYGKNAEGKAFRIDERKNPDFQRALDRIWQRGKHISAVDLSRITHAPGSAWSKASATALSAPLSEVDIANDKTYVMPLHL